MVYDILKFAPHHSYSWSHSASHESPKARRIHLCNCTTLLCCFHQVGHHYSRQTFQHWFHYNIDRSNLHHNYKTVVQCLQRVQHSQKIKDSRLHNCHVDHRRFYLTNRTAKKKLSNELLAEVVRNPGGVKGAIDGSNFGTKLWTWLKFSKSLPSSCAEVHPWRSSFTRE